jgi:broad specificity phosphatase PhoE
MFSTVYLIRNAATDWNRDARLHGRREIGLSLEGRAQADELATRFAGLELAEVLSSPLPRAVETAERLAARHKLEVGRDPRLTDLHAGAWEGLAHAELARRDDYRRFVAAPLDAPIPGGEKITDARDRMLASIAQALGDNELGAAIVIVSHATALRIAIAHYLGMEIGGFHRLRLMPASLTALRFESAAGRPRLLALDYFGDPRAVAT